MIRSSSVSTSKATSFDRHQLVQAKQHPVLLHRRKKERTNLINVNQYQQNGTFRRFRFLSKLFHSIALNCTIFSMTDYPRFTHQDKSCASDSRRSSVATTTSSYSHSTSETRNSTSTNNMPPPIQGSFSLGSNSFNRTRPIGAWEEPRSDAASPYDDNLVSFSPIISETTNNKNYANPSRAASHGTLPTRHEDLVDLDLDGFLRSEHGSIRSTRAHGGGRDGLMRQVENSLVTGKQINIRRGLVWCAAIGVLLVVTISVSMAFSAGAATPQQLPPSTTATTTLQGPAESNNGCSVTSNIQQDPFWQCDCENAISSYDTAFMDTYNSLKNTWITTLIPNFNEKLDSCTPLNQALTWLSFDVTQNPQTQHDEYNDRFLLAFLYATWKGRGWKNNAQWVSNEKSCKWFGVECDSKGRIVGIWMTENNLMGSLPSELTLLTNLGKSNYLHPVIEL